MSKNIFNSTWLGTKPSWAASLTVYETARTDTSATITLSLGLKVSGTYSGETVSSSWYAYNISWYAEADRVVSATQQIKGSGTWYGSESMRWFTKDIVVPAGLSSKTINIYSEFLSNNGGQGSVGKKIEGTFTISSRNTAPVWSGSKMTLFLDGNPYDDTSKTYIIPEDLEYVTARAPGASDADGDSYHFHIDRVVGSTFTSIKSWDANQEVTDTSVRNLGDSTWRYAAMVRDYLVANNEYRYSPYIKRNVFTAPTVSNPGAITEASNTVSFSVTAGYNTQTSGNTVSVCTNNTVTYELSTIMNGIAVTRGTAATSGNNTITISTSDPGTGIFINRNHIRDYVKDDGYTGVLTCVLKATNAYGSTTYTYFAFSVDLRANASGGSITSIGGQIGSFYFPAKKALTVNWSAGSTSTGETIKYSVQYSYDNSTWVTVSSGLTGVTSATVSSVTPNSSSSRTVYFRVGYTTTAGTAYSAVSQITAHYWNPPTLSIDYSRTETTARVTGNININTSASGASGIQVVTATYTGNGKSGNVTLSGSNQARGYSIDFTGLISTSAFPVTVTVKDTVMNINGDVASVITTVITGEVPALSIGSGGVTVRGNNSNNGDNSFVVYGNARITGNLTVDGSAPGGGGSSGGTGGLPTTGGTMTGALTLDGGMYMNSDVQWKPNTNFKLNATTANQEWSFDLVKGSNTGCYWQVWETSKTTLLKVDADNGRVYAPYGYETPTMYVSKANNISTISFPAGSGGNDPGWIKHMETTPNQGIMQFCASDDASDADYFEWGCNPSGTWQQKMKLTTTGNLSVVGSLTAGTGSSIKGTLAVEGTSDLAQIISWGHHKVANNAAYDLGESSMRWRYIYATDVNTTTVTTSSDILLGGVFRSSKLTGNNQLMNAQGTQVIFGNPSAQLQFEGSNPESIVMRKQGTSGYDDYTLLTTANAKKQWSGTQEQYDAITSKDANTLYIITDANWETGGGGGTVSGNYLSLSGGSMTGDISFPMTKGLILGNTKIQQKSATIFLFETDLDMDFGAKDLAMHYTGAANFYAGKSGSGVLKFQIGKDTATSSVPLVVNSNFAATGTTTLANSKLTIQETSDGDDVAFVAQTNYFAWRKTNTSGKGMALSFNENTLRPVSGSSLSLGVAGQRWTTVYANAGDFAGTVTLQNQLSASGLSGTNKQILYGGGTTLYVGNPSLSDIKIEGTSATSFKVSYGGGNYNIYHEGNPPPGGSSSGLKNGYVAHRGYKKKAPENTLKAIREAGQLGFVACEIDPRITSDGTFVLMHDDTVDRTTNGTGSIESKTLAQVKALRVDEPAGIIDEFEVITVPTLEEAIQELAYWKMGANLDGGYITWNESRIKTVYNLLVKYNIDEISMVSTPTASSRPLFAQYAPKLAQLIVTTPAELNNILTTYSYIENLIIGMKSNDATAEAIQTCNERNIPVFLYENFSVSHATMHLGKGVNYIETDDLLPQGGFKR